MALVVYSNVNRQLVLNTKEMTNEEPRSPNRRRSHPDKTKPVDVPHKKTMKTSANFTVVIGQQRFTIKTTINFIAKPSD